jgi:ribosomal protein L7/L12
MHQLDRMEEMLVKLTKGIPDDDTHVLSRDVRLTVTALFGFMRDDRKIEAIKAFRTLTGYGLKESKEEIESIMARMSRKRAA